MKRLWQDMILGASLRPQGIYSYLTQDGRSCAWGAVMEVNLSKEKFMYKDGPGIYFDEVVELFSWTLQETRSCPECNINRSIRILIAHINNHHGWTRERIALEFVKPIEEELFPVQTEVATEAVVEVQA